MTRLFSDEGKISRLTMRILTMKMIRVILAMIIAAVLLPIFFFFKEKKLIHRYQTLICVLFNLHLTFGPFSEININTESLTN